MFFSAFCVLVWFSVGFYKCVKLRNRLEEKNVEIKWNYLKESLSSLPASLGFFYNSFCSPVWSINCVWKKNLNSFINIFQFNWIFEEEKNLPACLFSYAKLLFGPFACNSPFNLKKWLEDFSSFPSSDFESKTYCFLHKIHQNHSYIG